jgi:hypothetical protein
MSKRQFFLLLFVLAVFFISYSDMVGNPFVGKLDLKTYFTMLWALLQNPSELKLSKTLLFVLSTGFGKAIIWMIKDGGKIEVQQN